MQGRQTLQYPGDHIRTLCHIAGRTSMANPGNNLEITLRIGTYTLIDIQRLFSHLKELLIVRDLVP